MLRLLVYLFVFVCTATTVCGQKRSIGLFRASEISKISILPDQRELYWLFNGVIRYSPLPEQVITLQADGNKIKVTQQGVSLGHYSKVSCTSDVGGIKVLKPLNPDLPEWAYAGSVFFTAQKGFLKIINEVEELDYLAGVLRGETGKEKSAAFYEAMAIMARTYACYYGDRHKAEGFDLCDQTHCQVYKGHFPYAPWFEAAKATKGLVMKDQEGICAEAVFHANCGGQTARASTVWKNDIRGCERVLDPFCHQSKGAVWEKRISKEEFIRKAGITDLEWNRWKSRSDSLPLFCYDGLERPEQLKLDEFHIHPVRWREKFGLRSAWFDIEIVNDEVVFSGRGFGHGVGLCQEGAMEMGRYGCTPQEILEHYFKGMHVTTLDKSNIE